MPVKVNAAAVAHARELIDQGKYRINTQWRVVEPNADQTSAFRARAGEAALVPWYLALDEQADGGGMRYAIGDFKSVHRSALQAARREAETRGETEVADAARDLIDWIDHYNAC